MLEWEIEEVIRYGSRIDVRRMCKTQELSQEIMIKHSSAFNRVTLYNNQAMSDETLKHYGLKGKKPLIKVLYGFGVHNRSIGVCRDGSMAIGCFLGNHKECMSAVSEKYNNPRLRHFYEEYIDGINMLFDYYMKYKEEKC